MDDLYAELKPDIYALADPLFGASETFLHNRGTFLPHGAVMTAEGKVELVMAIPPGKDRPVSTVEILPLLHDALRQATRTKDIKAVAVCEDVKITPTGQKQTAAVKVLVEHQRGLCIALYLPYQRKPVGGYSFGNMMALAASPEVKPWGNT
jgi:hypothetical protein